MSEPRTPPRAKRFAEPEITTASAVWRTTLAGIATARQEYRAHDPRLETIGIIVLAPALPRPTDGHVPAWPSVRSFRAFVPVFAPAPPIKDGCDPLGPAT